MLNFISCCKQKMKVYKNHFFSLLLIPVFFFSFSVKSYAADVLIGDGATGSVIFNLLEQSPSILNRGGSITKDGYLSIDLVNQGSYGAGGGVVSVMSNIKVDVTDVERLTLNCSIVSLPSNVSFEDLYFNFGLTSTNDGFPLNYITNAGNAAFPTLEYGLSEITSVSFPIEFNVSDVSGEYFITFGFSGPYISSNPKVILNFTDLILYGPNDKVIDVLDILLNGNENTESILGDFTESESNFNSVISDYKAVEQTFFNDFQANQIAITSDITGWSWGGLISCANWVGETMTDYYNNMGDFRQYIIYPLMLGIALFFLGRGSSIIGHLYRKPTETNTYTVSRSFRDTDGSKHTSTTTFRSGGIRR